MKASWFYVILVVKTITIRQVWGVNLVVLRDDDLSSEEESDSEISSDESKEIDMVLKLIEKETRDQSKPPVRTVRLIEKNPPIREPVGQHSFQKNRIEPQRIAQEYHVHYHNHQHKIPAIPKTKPEDNKIKPILLESLTSHFNNFPDLYIPQKPQASSVESFSGLDRFRKFRDFETLLRSKNQPPTGLELSKSSFEFPDNFEDLLIDPTPPSLKILNENAQRMRKYQNLLREKASIRSRNRPPANHEVPDISPEFYEHLDDLSSLKSLGDKETEHLKQFQPLLNSRDNSPENDFPNRERFSSFTDFSTLDNSGPRLNPTESEKTQQEEDDLEIKDFAIVIKTKPRIFLPKKTYEDYKGLENDYRKRRPGQQHEIVYRDPEQEENERKLEPEIYRHQPYNLPRILTSPGGIPQIIERINQMKYSKKVVNPNIAPRHYFHPTLNSVENQQRQVLRLRPNPKPNVFNRHIYNGWVIQRM